jgi:hypothetical protein
MTEGKISNQDCHYIFAILVVLTAAASINIYSRLGFNTV